MSERHSWDRPTSEVLPRQETGWSPKYEQGVPSDRPFNESPQAMSEQWVMAPSTSHISRFMFTDARENSLLRKFGRRIGEGGSSNPFSAGASELRVIFKKNDGSEDSEYVYWYNDHARGKDIFDRLKASPHPYSEVLHPEVVLNRSVPYQRVSRL